MMTERVRGPKVEARISPDREVEEMSCAVALLDVMLLAVTAVCLSVPASHLSHLSTGLVGGPSHKVLEFGRLQSCSHSPTAG